METGKKYFADPWNAAIVGGLVLLAAIGITLAVLRGAPKTDEAPREDQNAPAPSQTPNMGGGPEAKIIDDNEFEGAVVRYAATGFTPPKISLTERDAERTSCVIKIQNDTDEELVIRLGPPQEKDNKGFMYSAIPPKKFGIIDPRYSGIFEEEFYNRKIGIN